MDYMNLTFTFNKGPSQMIPFTAYVYDHLEKTMPNWQELTQEERLTLAMDPKHVNAFTVTPCDCEKEDCAIKIVHI